MISGEVEGQAPAGSTAGEALDDQLRVACGEGVLRITRLQKAGGKPMDARAFLRGHPVPAGTHFDPPEVG